MICPKCGVKNNDNWPLEIEGGIREGGCQMCWESECDKTWWEAMEDVEIYFAKGQGRNLGI